MTQTQIGGDRDDLLGQVVDEFFESVATGEKPELADYLRRYPEIADLLKVAIPAMCAAEDATTGADLSVGAINNTTDRQLGDFRILRQLGRGGMGIVYEADQISMRRRVALKVLPLAGLVDELKIQRFQNEVRAVAALDHPHIVSVYTVGEERGVHYFAMQLIRGRNLAQVIESLRKVHTGGEVLTGESVVSQITMLGQPDDAVPDAKGDSATAMTTRNPNYGAKPTQGETVARADDSTIPHTTRREYFRSVAALGIQAAKALQHAHEQGIVHRDVKPANLLLDKSSKLYVTDFGLARIESEAGVTMTGDLLGTLRYMAPEQALAKRVAVDHRADIYSLAVTLYELLTLQPAYQAEDRQLLLKQIALEEPARPRRIDPEIPAELETIVLKAMSKDMGERYSSAQEFGDDLRLYLEHRPIKAKPPTLPQIVNKWTRRNPVLTWATIVTLSLVTTAFAASTLLVANQWNKAVRAQQATEDQLRVATVNRLAAHSLAVQDERPIQSMLLAVEAVELSQQHHSFVPPIAHEALLNATQKIRRGRTLSGHGVETSTLAMTSDWLITLGGGKVHLWDLTAKEPTSSSRVLGDGSHSIKLMTLSRNGRWLVTSGSKLQRWDLNARNPDLSPQVLATDNIAVVSLALSADGRWLAAQDEDGKIHLWDHDAASPAPDTLSRQSNLDPGIALSPDGRWLVALPGDQPSTVQLWDLHAKDQTTAALLLEGHRDRIREFAMSPDSRWLVTASYDRDIRLWDLKSEVSTVSSQVIPAGNHVRSAKLQFTPDSRWLLAETDPSRVVRWDLSAVNSDLTRTVLPHKAEISSLEVSRDGRWLISGDRNGAATFWNLATEGSPSASFEIRVHDSVRAVAIHPRNRWLATAGHDGSARLWDLRSTDPTSSSSPFVLLGERDDVFSDTAISSDGRWIVTTMNGKGVYLWDVTGDPLEFPMVLRDPEATIRSVKISPDNHWLIAGSLNDSAQVWDLTSQDIPSSLKVLRTSHNKLEPVDHKLVHPMNGLVVIGPQSRWLALACSDRNIRLWDLTASDLPASSRLLRGHDSQVIAMAISGDGRWLVSGASSSGDPVLRLWDLHSIDTEIVSREWDVRGSHIFSLAIDANSRWMATPGPDNSIQLRDLTSDDPTVSRRTFCGSSLIWRVEISPNADWLFTSRFDGTAQLWDLRKQAATPFELLGHDGVQSSAISPDGHWLVAGCRSSNAYLWDLTAAEPATTTRVLRGHDEGIWSVCFSADSRWLVTDSSDGSIRRWCLDKDWLLNYAHEVAGRELTEKERKHYGIHAVRSENAADIQP